MSLLWELKIRDLLLHAVYALLPVSFPHVFNAKTKCIRQHFCQVFFLSYISALVAVGEELLVLS